MRLYNLLEDQQDVMQLQKELMAKISNLPTEGEEGEKTARVIDKIEQALRDVGAGGRVANILNRVVEIKDEDVQKATRKVAKIIAAVDWTGPEIKDLFVKWNAGSLVDTKALLTPGSSTPQSIYPGYGSNESFTELVDDLNQVSGYGIGEGEFTLAVLSPNVSGIGADTGAGDLIINGVNVEVKTRSVGAARFTDRDVTVTSEYTTLVKQFRQKYTEQLEAYETPTKSGLSLKYLCGFAQSEAMQSPNNKNAFAQDLGNILQNVFTMGVNVGPIRDAIMAGSEGKASQLYARANIDNYLGIKREKGALDGILFIDKKQGSLVYVRNSTDLDKSPLRFHQNTAYVLAFQQPGQYPFPQMYIK